VQGRLLDAVVGRVVNGGDEAGYLMEVVEVNSEPFQQGSLDFLCGIYCIVNAYKFIDPSINQSKAEGLFKELIESLGTNRLARAMTQGVSTFDIGRLLADVLGEKVARSRPFWNQPKITLDKFLRITRDRLLDTGGVALVHVQRKRDDLDHWTVIDRITPNQFQFFDSWGLRKWPRSSITLNGRYARSKTCSISAAYTYILSRPS